MIIFIVNYRAKHPWPGCIKLCAGKLLKDIIANNLKPQ
jgi:hypothetical protein